MNRPRGHAEPPPAGETQRIDRWLWFARLAKSRTLAASLVADGKVRVNRVRVEKPSHLVKPGDVLTVTISRRVRVLRVLAAGARRGPPTEARTLYEELTAPSTETNPVAHSPPRPHGAGPAGELQGQRAPGAGRPTKLERRRTERLKGKAS
jgi:ribosome-associated heat shock protein Hsp15